MINVVDIALLEGCISSSGSSEPLSEDDLNGRNMLACNTHTVTLSQSHTHTKYHLHNVLDPPATRY